MRDNYQTRVSRTGRFAVWGLLAVMFLCGLAPAAAAQQADPAGIATGDKSNAVDAGGNAFVVAEPTDKADPDYAAKKKAFDEYQAQAAKEPLAVKLADSVGHVRIAHQFRLDAEHRLPRALHAGRLRAAHVRPRAQEERRASDDAELRGVRVRVPRLLRVSATRSSSAPSRSTRRRPTSAARRRSTSFLIGSGQWGFLGGKGFFLSGPGYDAGSNVLTLFEVVFMETAGYIIVGSICERITFWAFLLCEIFVGALLYPIFGCWVWGGGWMSQLGSTMGLGHGYVDFAGSTVVHAVGGFCAMALAVILGPRLGKYDQDGKPRAFPAHNIVFVVTGTFILLFGWMGFNPGSTLGATDLRIWRDRHQHEPGGGRRFGDGDGPLVLHVRQAGHLDGVQRHAGRTGGDHRALRVRRPERRRHHRHHRRRHRLPRRAVQRARAQGRRPVRRDLGARILRLVRRRCARHLRGRHLRRRLERRRRGHLSRQGRPGRHRAAARRHLAVPAAARRRDALRRVGVRLHVRRLQGRERDSAAAREQGGRSSKVWTCPSSACWRIRSPATR